MSCSRSIHHLKTNILMLVYDNGANKEHGIEAKLEKRIHFKSELLGRGNILRVNGIYPHKTIVDLMVFDTQKSQCPLGLIVTTGYKAGLILQTYPQEAYSPNEHGIYRDD